MLRVQLGVLFLALLVGCSSPPPIKKVDNAERIRHEMAVGKTLALKLEPQFQIKADLKLTTYLTRMAHHLAENTSELLISDVSVSMVRQYGPEWRSYGLPGNRVYLSINLMKVLEFENELAAEISMQLGHIMERHALARFEEAKEGIFMPTDGEVLAAMKEAVGILYRAGYDPRGLVSLFDRLKENMGHSPYSEVLLDQLIEESRHEIAAYAPLRNPIVRSSDFVQARERISRL